MTERGRGARRHGRRHGRAALLYQGVLDAVDPRVLDAAETAEGLTDELALVRLLLRRQLESDPDNLEMTIKGLHLLVRMVVAQHKLSGEDVTALEGQLGKLADEMAIAILGKEPDGG
jgi:hypothetical protein